MAAVIYNVIKKAAGGAVQDDFDIHIELSWDTSVSPVAIDEDQDVMFQGIYKTQTDTNGRWEVEVVENDSITPASSVYKIVEFERGNTAATNEYYVSVPASATPTEFWVGDILAAQPSWEE